VHYCYSLLVTGCSFFNQQSVTSKASWSEAPLKAGQPVTSIEKPATRKTASQRGVIKMNNLICDRMKESLKGTNQDKPRIMIVDDEESIRRLLGRMLK